MINVDLNELLTELKNQTSNMTMEKYEFLKENIWLSPLKKVYLSILKKNGANEELLIRLEYSYLFENYVQSWYKTWNDIKWGINENEDLNEFAESALNQQINDLNKTNRSM